MMTEHMLMVAPHRPGEVPWLYALTRSKEIKSLPKNVIYFLFRVNISTDDILNNFSKPSGGWMWSDWADGFLRLRGDICVLPGTLEIQTLWPHTHKCPHHTVNTPDQCPGTLTSAPSHHSSVTSTKWLLIFFRKFRDSFSSSGNFPAKFEDKTLMNWSLYRRLN